MKGFIIALLLSLIMSTSMAFPVMDVQNSEDAKEVTETVSDIGEKVHEMTGKTVEEMREQIREYHGENVSEIAKKMGVNAKAIVLTRVHEIRERIRERIMNITNPAEKIRERMKEARTYRYEYAFEKWSLYMNKTIEKLDELGVNTTELSNLIDEYYDKYEELQEAEEEKMEIVSELKEIIREFRETAESLTEDFRTIESEVKQEMENELSGIKEATWEHLKEVALNVFDTKVEAAEHNLDVFEANGVDVTELRTMLDEIKAMRSDLETAYDEMNRTKIIEVNKEIREKWIEFRKAYAEAVGFAAHEKIAMKLEEFAKKIEEKAQKCGETINLSEIKQLIEEFKQNASKAPELRKAVNEKKPEIISILRCRITR